MPRARSRSPAIAEPPREQMGRELARLATLLAELQTGLGPVLVDAAAREPEVVRQAQALDLVKQSLERIASSLSTAAPELDDVLTLDRPASPAGARIDNGEVDWF